MPTPPTIELDLSNFTRFQRKVLRGLQDATPLMTLIGEELVDSTDDRFRNEINPDGSPWAALNPNYVEWKRRRGYITKKLQMRGDLRATIAYEANSDSVEIGANTPYARVQHEKRPYLYSERTKGLGRRDEARVQRVTDEFLQMLVDEAER